MEDRFTLDIVNRAIRFCEKQLMEVDNGRSTAELNNYEIFWSGTFTVTKSISSKVKRSFIYGKIWRNIAYKET